MASTINSKETLEQFILENWNVINRYIDEKQELVPTPLYASVDIRESKEKFAPIDHNLFPAGFNNLCALDLDGATVKFKRELEKISPNLKAMAILCESNTKNAFYLDHLAILGKSIQDAGLDVFLISFDEKIFKENELQLRFLSHSKFNVIIERAEIHDSEIRIKGRPQQNIDFILLNNDQSTPIEDVCWEQVKTPIRPTPYIGWFNRQKHIHFKYYKGVADEFCQHFSLDPSLIQAKFRTIENIDFLSKKGFKTLAEGVDILLSELPENRSVFVKAGQGTYGMGISVVSKGEDVINMNRKNRNKMNIGKNKIKFTSALIQEGLETVLKYDGMPAEVTIYLVAGESVGGFMRANPKRSETSNLNSHGMLFEKFCISEIRQNRDHKKKEATYSVIARLSTLASAYEIKDVI